MKNIITTGRITDRKKWEAAGWTFIDVTIKLSKGNARQLAPTWEMVNGYKNGTISEEQYVKQYEEIITRSQKNNPQLWRNTIERKKRIVFGCFCKTGAFCHRNLLAREFIRFAREEMGMEAQLTGEKPPRQPIRNTLRTFGTIKSLKKDEVFVFGSNNDGFHGAGTAGLAMRNDSRNTWRTDDKFQLAMKAPVGHVDRVGHWAVFGVGRGYQVGANGESYAIATVTKAGAKRSIPLAEITKQLEELFIWAAENKEKTVYCAINGGGLNGYSKEEIASAYPTNIPENVLIPKDISMLMKPERESGDYLEKPTSFKGLFDHLPSVKNSHYAGIGSREAPESVLKLARQYAEVLRNKGYTLRAGAAKGMDTAFESGAAAQKEIFVKEDCEEWCLEEVAKYVPSDRPPLRNMKPFVQNLLGRNMKQILGARGDKPVEFVVCWTPLGKDDGGTGYAIRCALAHGIPVYNIKNPSDHKYLRETILGLPAL